MQHEHVRRVRKQNDGSEIVERSEGQSLVKRWIGGQSDAGHDQRGAVRLGANDGLGAEIGIGAGPVHHHERLLEALAETVGEQARQEIGSAAGREWHDQLDRARRIIVRPRGGNAGQQPREAQYAAEGEAEDEAATLAIS
jgi:hypothetical protein